MTTYAELEQRIQQWALTRADVQAVLVVGSRARAEHPADDFSDLDLVLFTTDTSLYKDDRTWLESFGAILFAAGDVLNNGITEWIVVYEGVLKGDFTFSQSTQVDSLADELAHFPFQDVLSRGLHALVDKYPQAKPLDFSLRPFRMPTAAQFEQTVADFWIVATRVVKFIQRGDLWRAVTMLYCKMRFQLTQMLEWHAHALHGLDYDTWYDGRFLDDWLDAEILADLPYLFTRYDAVELKAALQIMIDLFRRLAKVVADHLGYDYPQAADNQLTTWIQTG